MATRFILTFLCIVLLKNEMQACTAFQLKTKDGASLYCRSMEYEVDLKSDLLIVPQGTVYEGTAPKKQKGIKWTTKYGLVGMNQWASPTFVNDGMNEKGLVVGVLYLPRFAEYEKLDPTKLDRTLAAWELASYLLSTCANLEEVKAALKDIRVVQQPLPGTQFSFPLHYYITDNSGKVLIVEYVKGQRFEHNNPIGVLTNAPPFEWHVHNLSNFVNLSPVNVPELDLDKVKVHFTGQGSGMLGIPGDYTPPSRFIRATLFSHWAIPSKNALEGVLLGFHILNTFDIFYGIVRETKENQSAQALNVKNNSNAEQDSDLEYTQWTIIHDKTNLKTYFRSYESLQVQMVDLTKLDFTKPGFKKALLQHEFDIVDMTTSLKPLKEE